MKRRDDFIKTVQLKVAVSAISPSALRAQGKGVLKATRDFLAGLSLARIPKSSPKLFNNWLDRQTKALLDELPIRNRPWGAARKALNLFLRDVLYNKYLSRQFGFQKIEPWLEIALDSIVAKGLKRHAGIRKLPAWPGMKRLTPKVSDQFQNAAIEHARSEGMDRVHLDMYLWLGDR